VLYVGDDKGAIEVETALVELRLISIGNKVTVNTGLELVAVSIVDIGGSIGQVVNGPCGKELLRVFNFASQALSR
jgi:hypothetical protein